MRLFKPSLIIATVMALFLACSGGTESPRQASNPTATPQPAATSQPTATPRPKSTIKTDSTGIPIATPEPKPSVKDPDDSREQDTKSPTRSVTTTAKSTDSSGSTTATSSPEDILYRSTGNGTGVTAASQLMNPFKVRITYSGGPVKVRLLQANSRARQIYNGPESKGIQYESGIINAGTYRVEIICDQACGWDIRIIKAGERVSEIASTESSQSNMGSTPSTAGSSTETRASSSESNSNQTNNAASTAPPLVVAEEWDVFKDAESSIVLSAPNTSKIDVSYDGSSNLIQVAGNSKAVPANAHVMIANLELGGYVLAKADKTGAFRAEINGHPGTHVLIKQDTTGEIFKVDDPASTHGPNTLRTIFPPGVLVRIPIEQSSTGVPFSSAGRLPSDTDAPWTINGTLAQNELTAGQSVSISGEIAIRTAQANRPPSGRLNFEAHLLINGNGRQVGGARVFTTSLFTATDLPIESKDLLKASHSLGDTELTWRFQDGVWVSAFSSTITLDPTTANGLYQLKAQLSGISNLPRKSEQTILHRSFLQQASVTTFTVGDPSPMRLTATLLADELSEGSRGGIVAREDQGLFDITHRAGVRHQPIIPRLDNYGKLWRYRLDPYIPLLGLVDRAPPAAPSIEFDFATSSLTITIKRPDGRTDTLGPADLTRYAMKSPRTPWHKTVSEGGGNLGEIPQLQAASDNQFSYRFTQDGDYVVTLDGKINDIAGRVYSIDGTYDLAIANVLDIETSLLPGTPFDVGDSLPVGLRIMPGVPATVDYQVKHISPSGLTTTRSYKGTANAGGWWDGGGASFKFDTDGEYRVDVEARYTDIDKNLWVGRLTFGSAVATPDAPMILHGRRGPNRLNKIPPAWGFPEDFKDTDADHIQMPYFSGDVMWGQNAGHLKDSVAILTSMQITDDSHPLISRVKAGASAEGGDIPKADLLKAGQLPFGTDVKPGTLSKLNQIDLWAYSYASVQRPGIRVREHILADDLGGTYWRFNDAYHMQSGNGRQGDLPGDFKFMYAAAVIRDPSLKQGVYATYGSGWVMTDDKDPLGARFMPPFRGAAGGPDGGPLFTIHGREIGMFFLPLGTRPGAILKEGESFRLAGPVMPTLPSQVKYTVTSPDGSNRVFEGRANQIGYYYQPEDDFIVDQAGTWTVNLTVTHDGMTSAGPVQEPFPSGGPLTPDVTNFKFFVLGPADERLAMSTNLSNVPADKWFSNVRNATFEAELPKGWTDTESRVVVTIPGIVLVDQRITPAGGKLSWALDAKALNKLANNFDYEQGIADTIEVTFYVEGSFEGKRVYGAETIITHGARVPTAPELSITLADLPELSSFSLDKTDQFIVDLADVVGGHPYRGQNTQDPDDGAHVNWDNSRNKWPKGTSVTDFPAIYAISDGYIEMVNTYESVGGGNHKYSIHMMFAQQNGRGVKFHMAIEPSMSPGDSSFYEPFILVKKGQSVHKGQVLAHMYLQPDDKYPGPHIHFSVQPEGEHQQAPAIFTDRIVEDFHSRFGIFGFESDQAIPACMGYKLTGSENPFSASPAECLR